MKETLEEAAGKSFEEIWASLTTEQSEYLKSYINKKVDEAKKWQAEQMYSEEDLKQAYLDGCKIKLTNPYHVKAWFILFKKK